MKNTQKNLIKIRELEHEIDYADPKDAARIGKELVRLRASAFLE